MDEEKSWKIREKPSEVMVFVKGGDTEIQGEGVTLDSFYIAKAQVTQELYESVMKKNPSNFRGKNLPVESVSWYGAVKFCNALSNRDGLTPCYSGSGKKIKCDFSANGYRLPTEAEWEYAASGGKNEDGYGYAGSDDIDEVAWYDENCGNHTQPVAKKKPNSLGLYDISGNVWEWCWDWYDDEFTGGDNPFGASAGGFRVLRGGSWYINSDYASVCLRSLSTPVNRNNRYGFRLARSV